MGDKEFEDYLNRDEEGAPECQKRLLFDIIQQKLTNSTELVGIYADLLIRFPKKAYEVELEELRDISKNAFEQLDYLMSVLLDEIDGGPENPDTGK